MFFKYIYESKNWLPYACILAVGYTLGFIVVAAIFLVFNSLVEVLKNNFAAIACYSFFTGPCALIVMPVIIVILGFMP